MINNLNYSRLLICFLAYVVLTIIVLSTGLRRGNMASPLSVMEIVNLISSKPMSFILFELIGTFILYAVIEEIKSDD